MSSGAKVSTAWIREVTPGVTPAGAWNVLTRTSFGVIPSYNTAENNEIGEDRMSQGTSQTTVDVAGDVGTKMRYNALDEFMASCFGKDWASNVLTMGNDRITFSLGYYASDVGIAGVATGAQVSTMNIQVPNDGEIEITTTFTATGWKDKADDTSYIVTPATEQFQRRYGFKDVSGLKLNGVQVGDNNVCVDTFNLQFDNAVQTQRCIGNGNPFAGNIIPTTFTPSGSITLSWSKTAYELWKKQQTGDAISFEFTIGNADGSYDFLIPEMEISGSWPDGGATDIIQVELSYTARRVSPTITRHPAPTGVTVTPSTASVAVGATSNLSASVAPSGAVQAVTWSSSATGKATVSASGVVTGVAAGSATITATSTVDGTKTGTCTVTVTA
ncbi:Ig-like domain-containing protein [Pseudomonas protegens]|uniref:phage tail tube protein n=1 Tax=Pseudomonas protegens TaxID=380021 RepID=UPI001C8DC946|nr:phage tail tube protein [Pseudomonas protegens]QZI68671.1 Ig-like domain-containing protein [Pseudomonas protegens]